MHYNIYSIYYILVCLFGSSTTFIYTISALWIKSSAIKYASSVVFSVNRKERTKIKQLSSAMVQLQ